MLMRIGTLLLMTMVLSTGAAYAATAKAALQWEYDDTIHTKFVLERKVGTGAYAVVSELPPEARQYTEAGLPVGVDICYRNTPYNGATPSLEPVEACGRVEAVAVPRGVKSFTVTITME